MQRLILLENTKPENHIEENSIDGKIFKNIWSLEILPFWPENVSLIVSDYRFDPNILISIKNKYTNNMFVAYTKERTPEHFLPLHRIQLFNECDKVALPYREEVCKIVAKKLNKTIYQLPYPYDIKNIKKLFYKPWNKRENRILAWVNPRRGENDTKQTIEFAKTLGNKYNYKVITTKEQISWRNWLELLSTCKFMVNLDNKSEIGQIPIECAILDVVHLGSQLDAARVLFPITATNNIYALEFEFNRIKNNPTSTLNYSHNKVVERHSFESAKKNLEKIINE